MNALAQRAVPRAAIDVGSNSVRLLVIDADGQRIEREMAITRLAKGVDVAGHFDDDAFDATVHVIADFADRARRHAVGDRIRVAATSAVRDAADRDRFVAAVRQACGLHVEVLSGAQEAAMAFAGAIGTVAGVDGAVIVDIGGGSTELIVGSRRAGGIDVDVSVSLQMGCVRMTERHLATDPPTRDERLAMALEVAALLDDADGVIGLSQRAQAGMPLVAVAGTATTMGALHLGLVAYDEDRIHGVVVPSHDVTELAKMLMAMPSHERARLGPMQAGREDVIHAGALILDAVVRRGGFADVVISEADSLDGLAASA
ncbi:MAG: hypothetical protein WD358_02950 [Nitriliruptoraceae bacterium]